MSFQKRCQSNHNSTRLILRNTDVFGSNDRIEGLISTKSVLYDSSHAEIRLGNLIFEEIILLLCRCSGGCEGGVGGMNADLPYGRNVL